MKPLILIAFAAFVVYVGGTLAGGCMQCLSVGCVLMLVPMIMKGIAKGTRDM